MSDMMEWKAQFNLELRVALRKGYRAALVLLDVTGIAALLVATLDGKSGSGAGASLVRFFFYFSIQSSLAVAVWVAITVFRREKTPPTASAVSRDRAVHLALLVSSILTAGGYYILLHTAIQPTRLAALGDMLLHAVVPAMFVLDWILYETKGRFRVGHLAAVLVLPALHLVAALVRGAFTGDYPYTFLDPEKLGIAMFLRNAAGFAALFLTVAALLLLLDRMMRKRPRKAPTALPE